ncbi:MAG: UvrD-helicase domain-containing protein [Solobacterium sp.]|nr:UvrD-helicase domain-containing protein [Solobacterium sp.]
MIDLSILNENQKEAVLSDDQYLRIIAGAGSGKTRVLTMRIAHLIEDEDIRPYKILAITFTNKAANEMKERVLNMLEETGSSPWISTIHSLCVRILRQDIEVMGWPKNFTIMDADDQKSVVKEAYKEFDIDSQKFSYASTISYISNNKTAGINVEKAYELAGSYREDQVRAKVYEYYVNRQKSMFALDFDDLIITTVSLFAKYKDVLEKWQNRFEYILVDEFQDIDSVQYKLIRYLAGDYNSLYVVGDPDQTIYTWRGADVNIIMDFVKDFKGAKTIILNENYRSTDAILNGANSLIQNNRNRVKKDLFTQKKSDEKIVHYAASGDEYQASWIAAKIKELHQKGQSYNDFAILYRSNYLSRSLEKAMLDERIPYVIYGGIRFYERQEVKDALCYMRMAANSDDLALQRILNTPRRGIGNKTMDLISKTARETGQTMYEVLKNEDIFSGRTKNTINAFVSMVENWKQRALDPAVSIKELFEDILKESGYLAMLEENKENERIENIKELVDDAREFSETYPDSTLDEYLQLVSLYGDRDEVLSSDFVRLMTVHAAKGLEFDTVFVSDMNDGIFPNERAMSEGYRGVEEERRLAYVAFTRARNKLYITEAGGFSYLLQKGRVPSRFIKEIDKDTIEHVGVSAPKQEDTVFSHVLFDTPQKETFTQKLEKSNVKSFKKGDQVVHAKFGEGVVIKCANGVAEIAFPYPYGVKKIISGHPSLKKKGE